MATKALFDLHCDTLTSFMDNGLHHDVMSALTEPTRQKEALEALVRCSAGRDTLNDPTHQFILSQVPDSVHWCQCCAIFLPDHISPQASIFLYQLHRDNFYRQMAALHSIAAPCQTAEQIQQAWRDGKTACILTVENGSALAGHLERVAMLAQDGVKMITLTWNGENEIGAGSQAGHGLSAFGKAVIPELERHNILIDISHLNDSGFYDLLDIASKPFVASHSNARSICGHSRNLTDGQIRELVTRRCLIGLNYYNAFLRSDHETASLDDFYRHLIHFLELGAEDALALGSDFDGASMPPCLDSMEKAAFLGDYLTGRGLSCQLTEKILWRNALEFWEQNISA